MWRLLEWALIKLNDEVTRYVIEEKIVKRDQPGSTPDPAVLRVAKANLVEHLHYFNWVLATRHWIAGDAMTLADFALAAHLCALDYLGDVTGKPRSRCTTGMPGSSPAPPSGPCSRTASAACRPMLAAIADLDF